MKKISRSAVIRLEKPLAPGVSFVTVDDPTFSDLAGAITGVKPVTYTDCLPEELPRIARLCEKLKLTYLLTEEFLGKRGPHFRNSKKMVLIGRNPADLRKAALAWKHLSTGEQWGCLLGYPECCVKAYKRWAEGNPGKKARPDIIPRIFANTKKTAGLDFRLNNIWNYFSRMNFNHLQECASYEKFIGLNRNINLPAAHVISWHPCSYDCAESVRKAGEIFSFMRHHAPVYAAELRERLAKPAIFWDKFEYAFVDGRVKKGVLNYRSVLPPRSLLGEKLSRLLDLSDAFRMVGPGAGFYRRGRLLFSAPGPRPLLLDFGEDAGRRGEREGSWT